MSRRERSRAAAVLSVLFGILALNAWVQVVLALVDESRDPSSLAVLQFLVGAAAAAAAWGSWRGRRWAPLAAIAYGAVTAALLLSLDPLLDLGPDARGGLWTGAVFVLLFGVVAAWYLRRALTRNAVGEGRPATGSGKGP